MDTEGEQIIDEILQALIEESSHRFNGRLVIVMAAKIQRLESASRGFFSVLSAIGSSRGTSDAWVRHLRCGIGAHRPMDPS